VTTDHKDQQQAKGLPKTYLYEFSAQNNDGNEVSWNAEDMDILLCTRLSKMRQDNKFFYLYQSYERIGAHLLCKTKGFEDVVKELKSITCRYFVTLFSFPETFDLSNDYVPVQEKEKFKQINLADQGEIHRLQTLSFNQWVMLSGGMMPTMLDCEDIQSNKVY